MRAEYTTRQRVVVQAYGAVLLVTGLVFAACLQLAGDAQSLVWVCIGVAAHAVILLGMAYQRVPIRTWCLAATVLLACLMAWVLLAADTWDVLHWLMVPVMISRWISDTKTARWSLGIALGLPFVMIIGRLSGISPEPWLPLSSMLSRAGLTLLFLLATNFISSRNAHAYEDAVDGHAAKTTELEQEVAQHEQTRQQLIEEQHRTLSAARAAGMAEIATGVLHNLGNALNSITVSSQVLRKADHGADIASRLRRASAALASEQQSPAKVAVYLTALAEHCDGQQRTFDDEIRRLTDAIGHVERVVSAQQAHARSAGVMETFHVTEMLEDVRHLTQHVCAAHTLAIDAPLDLELTTERHYLVQIVENLIRNAAEAMTEAGMSGQITVRIRAEDRGVVLTVTDAGPGLSPSDAEQIFRHGFTTKETGSGFGLHASALNAKSLGGELMLNTNTEVGASFQLILPSSTQAAA